MPRPAPYLSVSALTKKDDVLSVTKAFHDAGFSLSSPCLPVVGFLLSQGEQSLKKRWPKRYADPAMLPELLTACTHILPAIHYEAPNAGSIAGELTALLRTIAGAHPSPMLQVNTELSDDLVKQLDRLHQEFPTLPIILQLRPGLLGMRDPDTIAKTLLPCAPNIRRILIDPSCGVGTALDLTFASALYRTCKTLLPDVGIGFAGGLSGRNLNDVLTSLIETLGSHDFSIDAESGLRGERDELDLAAVAAYIRAARPLLA